MLCKRRLKAFAEMHLDAKTCTQELEHDVNVHREWRFKERNRLSLHIEILKSVGFKYVINDRLTQKMSSISNVQD